MFYCVLRALVQSGCGFDSGVIGSPHSPDCRGERREDERKEKESTGIKIKKKDRVGIDGGGGEGID